MDSLITKQAAIDALIKWYGYEPADIGAFENIVEKLPSVPSEPQWILCSEQLPKDGKWCLFTDGVNISVERYKADAIDHFFPQGRWFSLEDAVAWMPLPTKPYVEQT